MSRRWRVGEAFVLRHAGFPFDWVEELGCDEATIEKADAVLAAERALLAAIPTQGARATAAAELAAGRPPKAPKPKVEGFDALVAAYGAAREALTGRLTAERARIRAGLHARSSDVRVQEAVFLSSPAMFDNVWSKYTREPLAPENADSRRVDRQAYTYLQRLCAKNETTSFFGPMGYGFKGDPDGAAIRVVPTGGPKRRTFFAFWAVNELAKAVNREPELRAHLPVRRNPLFELSPGKLSMKALGLNAGVSADAERLLERAGRGGSLQQIAADLGLSIEAAEKIAAPLFRVTALLRGIPFRQNDFSTFESLRASVAELASAHPAAARWVSVLDELKSGLEAFQAAPLAERLKLLPPLEKKFEALTGQAARRGEGQIYSDRFIFYEEGQSPFRLEFSPALYEKLEAALSPPLELSAAFGERVQAGHKAWVKERVGALPGPVDFLTYAVKARPEEVGGSRFAPVPPLELPPSEGAFADVPSDIAGRTEGARYALPDVCLDGPRAGSAGPDAYQILLSRVHHHLLLWSWLCAFHPERARHEKVASSWLSENGASPEVLGLSIRRRNKGFYQFPGRRLVYAVTDTADLDEGAVPGQSLSVTMTAEGPELHDASGARKYLYIPLDDFSHYSPFASLAHPLVLHAPLRREGASHLPRTTIGGGAIYQRQRWELPAEPFGKASGLELFLLVHRTRRAQGWPRFLYARTNVERKPYLIDTQSPYAMELLRHLVKGAERVSFEEMFPRPEGLWLSDEAGRYTCELRMQAGRWATETT